MVSRHLYVRFRCYSILAFPQTRHSLRLRVEIQARLSVEGICTSSSHTLFVSSEREHRERYWDRHVDADLSGLDFLLKACGRTTATCEDSHAVAILVLVDELDSIIHCVNIDTNEDWAENLLGIAFHVRFDVCYHRGPDLP